MARAMAQMVEYLPSKHEALSSNPTKKEKKPFILNKNISGFK
jgi:hypothetical protein